MAEETTVTDPPVTAEQPPAESPPPPAPQKAPPPESTTPGGEPPPEGPAAPEPAGDGTSAFDKLIEAAKTPEELEAIIDRAREKLPEERRAGAKPDEGFEQQRVQEARRREQIRDAGAKRDTASQRLNEHLKDVRTRALDPNRDGDVDYDADLLTQNINELVSAQAFLDGQEYRETVGNAIVSRLQKAGVKLDDLETLQSLAKRADDGEHGIIGAYLDEYGQRQYQQGFSEGEKKAQAQDATWRAAEKTAIRSELQAEGDFEPDAGVASRGPGDLNTYSGLARAVGRGDITQEEFQRRWSLLEAGG